MSSDDAQPYQRVMGEIRDRIRLGRLRPGDRLPSARLLAEELSVAPGTVQHAYGELRRQGVIYSQQGRGSYVSDDPPVSEAASCAAETRIAALEERIAELAARVEELERDRD